MQQYSDFFKTLHDELAPTGNLGRGTHYSVLRAVVFHDINGKPLPEAQFADFAVIWDEDHDTRVFEAIEHIYQLGHLPSFIAFGERKGCFTSILSNEIRDQRRVTYLTSEIERVTQSLESDPWSSSVTFIGSKNNVIISDADAKVSLYLSNIAMLWELGLKKIGASPLGSSTTLATFSMQL